MKHACYEMLLDNSIIFFKKPLWEEKYKTETTITLSIFLCHYDK